MEIKQGQAYIIMGNRGIEAMGGTCKASELKTQMFLLDKELKGD